MKTWSCIFESVTLSVWRCFQDPPPDPAFWVVNGSLLPTRSPLRRGSKRSDQGWTFHVDVNDSDSSTWAECQVFAESKSETCTFSGLGNHARNSCGLHIPHKMPDTFAVSVATFRETVCHSWTKTALWNSFPGSDTQSTVAYLFVLFMIE